MLFATPYLQNLQSFPRLGWKSAYRGLPPFLHSNAWNILIIDLYSLSATLTNHSRFLSHRHNIHRPPLVARLAGAAHRGLAESNDLHDLGRLMVLQGPQPSEVLQARVEHVNAERGTWSIPKSKFKAGKSTLKLTSEALAILTRRADAAGPDGWLFAGKVSCTHLMDVQNAYQKSEPTGPMPPLKCLSSRCVAASGRAVLSY